MPEDTPNHCCCIHCGIERKMDQIIGVKEIRIDTPQLKQCVKCNKLYVGQSNDFT